MTEFNKSWIHKPKQLAASEARYNMHTHWAIGNEWFNFCHDHDGLLLSYASGIPLNITARETEHIMPMITNIIQRGVVLARPIVSKCLTLYLARCEGEI